jgi:hypothetical protein
MAPPNGAAKRALTPEGFFGYKPPDFSVFPFQNPAEFPAIASPEFCRARIR